MSAKLAKLVLLVGRLRIPWLIISIATPIKLMLNVARESIDFVFVMIFVFEEGKGGLMGWVEFGVLCVGNINKIE